MKERKKGERKGVYNYWDRGRTKGRKSSRELEGSVLIRGQR